ncbi:MAG: M55 family metallopeptidase [Methanobacteriota archaeon]
MRTLPDGSFVKVFLSVDMEGIGGITREIQTDPDKGGAAYQESRKLMTLETNAAVEGCLRAGGKEVLVADSHWNFTNLIAEDLHEAANLLSGSPRPLEMVDGLDGSFDAAMFVGYHAMAGTPRAILDHTYTGRVRSVEVNGRPVGETGINAYYAGHLGVPVVLVTGDTAVTAEAQALLDGVHVVAVKDAIAAESATSASPKRTRERIRDEATKALRDRKTIRPVKAVLPVQFLIDFQGTGHADKAELVPGVHRKGGTRIAFESRDYRDAYRTFLAVLEASRP